MITLSAKIKVSANTENSKITEVQISHNALPIASEIADVLNKSVSDPSPFLFGISTLGGGSSFLGIGEKVGFYMGNVLSDSNGVFSKRIDGSIADAYTMSFISEQLTSATIEFDTKTSQYATEIELWDGGNFLTAWKNDDAIFVCEYPFKDGKRYSFVFRYWSAPNSPLVIRSFRPSESYLIINNRNAISIKPKFKERGDMGMPTFGLYSNTGSIEFKDTDGEIFDLIEQKALRVGSEIDLFIENKVYNKTERVFPSTATITELDYDSENMTVSVTYSDGLERLQEMHFDGMRTDIENAKSQNLYSLIGIFRSGFPVYVSDGMTENHLKSVIVPYPFVEKSSIWEALTKICVAGQCRIFSDTQNYGKQYLIKYNGGV